ncbi:hypothetical protein RhiirA5_438058 [Rhizophagus irregularis]|uniref:Uncharacterized protein n=1 Tax=Rhizophagus irregularis TaxID=588596 RepID=A0A2N0QP59_9GLOM|nr:hypothetical protein RhiirA5_438058 [Rhizophagus irregularis]PKC52839.1 hypothetical protein RhiirA1_480562 [Rhizophagus irregularis]
MNLAQISRTLRTVRSMNIYVNGEYIDDNDKPKTDQKIAKKWKNEYTHNRGTFGIETSKKRDQEVDIFLVEKVNETKRNELNTNKQYPKNCTFNEYVDGECIDDDNIFEESQLINWKFNESMPT